MQEICGGMKVVVWLRWGSWECMNRPTAEGMNFLMRKGDSPLSSSCGGLLRYEGTKRELFWPLC